MEIAVLFRELISPDNLKHLLNNLIILTISYLIIKPKMMAEAKNLIDAAMMVNDRATLANAAYNIKELAEKILRAKKIDPKDVEMLTMLAKPYKEGGGNGFAEALVDKALKKFKEEKHPEENEHE